MIGIFNRSTISALEQTITFAERRHTLLAGNVANLDVPGYKAKDLSTTDFQAALAKSLDTSSRTSPGEIGTELEPSEGPKRAMENLLYHDESEVNLERQVTELAKNYQMHNMAIALMRSQFAQLEAAISERV